MADNDTFDLIVIGAGPGGYVAAIKAAQLGLKTALVEKQYIGGTCLNVGCIPSKAMLDSSERYVDAQSLAGRGIEVENIKLDLSKMLAFKDDVVKKMTGGIGFLLKKNKIAHLEGFGKVIKHNGGWGVEVEGKAYGAKNVLIATGSVPNTLPTLTIDEKKICSSTGALEIEKVPQKMLIVGGGYIGVEIGSVWNRLGSEVHVIEYFDRILPASDAEAADKLFKELKKQGLKFHLSSVVKSATVKGDKVEVVVEPKDGGEATTFTVDNVMVSVGRKPLTEGIGLAEVGGQISDRGFVEVDDNFEVKGAKGIYAIGDVIGKIMLAHNAEQEGKAVAEFLAEGTPPFVNYFACPAVVYTHPELASVGYTEEQCKEKGLNIKVGKFPLTANGRARGMGQTEGFVKVIGDADSDKLLGVHILAPHASDMIGEATVAIEFASSVEDLARCFHAHPTLPEAIKEAAMAADKHAIHI